MDLQSNKLLVSPFSSTILCLVSTVHHGFCSNLVWMFCRAINAFIGMNSLFNYTSLTFWQIFIGFPGPWWRVFFYFWKIPFFYYGFFWGKSSWESHITQNMISWGQSNWTIKIFDPDLDPESFDFRDCSIFRILICC